MTEWETSVSPEDSVEVKQPLAAEEHETDADSGEVRRTGSYYAVLCVQTDDPVTLPFSFSATLSF